MKGLCILALMLMVPVSHAQQIQFLEQKTAFCYSKKALAKYLNHAEQRNLDGMNNLVLNGKCGFVPDGEVVRLKKYEIKTIGKRPVVRFKMNNNVCWTPKVLVQTADFSNL
ncbi:MAG: hypothetical protein PVF34_05870 [Gammaproteobacteria bacterium]